MAHVRTDKHRAAERKWKKNNPDKVAAQQNRWYTGHKEAQKARGRAWYEKNLARAMLLRVQERAGRLGLPFDLELSDIVIPSHCPALGIPIQIGSGKTQPASPTIDRIKPALGYVRGNVCVISHRANTIKSDATADEVRLVAVYIEACEMNNPIKRAA